MKKLIGFSITELLIAIGVLGLISAFAIPKLLRTQEESKLRAIGKETASTLKLAYAKYKLNHGISDQTRAYDIVQELNYVKVKTTPMDKIYGSAGEISCTISPCYLLENGASIWVNTGNRFGSTEAKHSYVYFVLDPDGKLNSSDWNSPNKALQVNLYRNGRVSHASDCVEGDLTYQGGYEDWCPNTWGKPKWIDW